MKKDTKRILKEFNEINSKLLKFTLKEMLSESRFQAISKKSGEVVDFKSKETMQAAIKAGTHDDVDKKKDGEEKSEPSGNLSADDFAMDAEKDNKPKKSQSSDMMDTITNNAFVDDGEVNGMDRTVEFDVNGTKVTLETDDGMSHLEFEDDEMQNWYENLDDDYEVLQRFIKMAEEEGYGISEDEDEDW
jgi:hypothetical protein